jgi:hypothetical protein
VLAAGCCSCACRVANSARGPRLLALEELRLAYPPFLSEQSRRVAVGSLVTLLESCVRALQLLRKGVRLNTPQLPERQAAPRASQAHLTRSSQRRPRWGQALPACPERRESAWMGQVLWPHPRASCKQPSLNRQSKRRWRSCHSIKFRVLIVTLGQAC